MWKVTAVLSAATLAVSGTALAGHHEEKSTTDKFAMVDTDSDGGISEAEFMVYWDGKVAMKQEAGEWTDKSEEELATKGAAHFEEMGGDDGVVTLEEYEAHYADMSHGMSEKEDA